LLLDLVDPRASDPAVAGAKAANLAAAATVGLPVQRGFVLTTGAFDPAAPGWPDQPLPAAIDSALRSATGLVAPDGTALVVRSSSTVEDIGASSMAGQFRSHLGVVGWSALESAVRDVQRSALGPGGVSGCAPMAVLVQRQVDARLGGVLFGLEPVTGDRRRLLVEVVPGGPEALVSGEVTAQRYLLGRRGRVIEGPDPELGPELLDRRTRARLAGLLHRCAARFGGPQDVEWAIDGDGHLWLLQSRPVTAQGQTPPGEGPVLGPGPVAETFPEPLRPLEVDLWVEPLREGILSALTLVGAVPARELGASPLVTTVGGRVACDLTLLRASPLPGSRWRWLDPRVPARRLASAWRIGRLRAVLPTLAADMCRRVDAELAALAPLAEFDDAELVELVQRARTFLVSVHGHEILAGTLLQPREGMTAARLAMSVVLQGRALGLSDAQIVARWPVAMALTAPRIGAVAALPPVVTVEEGNSGDAAPARVADLPAREALRLRARWLQELMARAAGTLASRLTADLRVPGTDSLALMSLQEVEDVVSGWPAPAGLTERARPAGPPLPAMFQLSAEGNPLAVRLPGSHRPGGRGAAGGRAEGVVVHEPGRARPGDILVTRTLDPRLAGFLPALGGLVSETGGVLSHLAILAREYGVPTVVGVDDALDRYAPGSRLLVDGTTGEVRPIAGPDGGDPP
jgi:pyruvate,water dikinase